MSQFREYDEVEMTGFQPPNYPDSDQIYYNTIPGQRISPSDSDYVVVSPPTSRHEGADLSQSSDGYEDTLLRRPGDGPTFESFGYEYEDTMTIKRPLETSTRDAVERDHNYEDTLPVMTAPKQRKPFEYEDIPGPANHRPRNVPTLAVQEDVIADSPTPVKMATKSRSCGSCWKRALLLWVVLLLGLLVAAAVYIGLLQTRFNALELQCNMTVPLIY